MLVAAAAAAALEEEGDDIGDAPSLLPSRLLDDVVLLVSQQVLPLLPANKRTRPARLISTRCWMSIAIEVPFSHSKLDWINCSSGYIFSNFSRIIDV